MKKEAGLCVFGLVVFMARSERLAFYERPRMEMEMHREKSQIQGVARW